MVSSFKTVGKEYDKDKIESHIVNILNAQELIGQFQAQIRKLDEEKKKNEKIQDLIDERIELEEQNKQLDDEIDELNKSYGVYEKIYKQSKKKFENKTKDIKDNKEIERKIKLLSEVKSRLESELKEMSKKYSENLKVNIEFLLNNMLTSRRKVSVTSDFFVKVYDSYGDESKSEGQFAVVSFAYIGAILKLLKEQKAIKNKEYPLVLDGPFSKLDEDQKQNVINEIPKFAPQIILFSKDNLQEYFQNGMIGDVWTIVSNDERNISTIEEGYQWK